MTTELRPRTLGEILDATAQLYRGHFLLFVGIAVFPRALMLVFQLLQIGASRYFDAHHLPSLALTIVAAVVGLVLYFILVGLGLAATNSAVSALYLGQPATIASSYLQVRPHWIRYLAIMFVTTLYAWGPTILPYAGILAVVGIGGKKFTQFGVPVAGVAGPQSAGALAGVGILAVAGLCFLITVPFGIWMSLRYSMAVPASIFEKIGVTAAMKRSVHLSKKGRGRIFVMLLMVGIIFYVIAIAAETPFIIGVMRAAKNHQQPPVLSLVYAQFVSFVLYSLMGPIYGIAITLFYYDERIRKEGFDIEWMMQRANLGSPDGPPMPSQQLEPQQLEPQQLEPQQLEFQQLEPGAP